MNEEDFERLKTVHQNFMNTLCIDCQLNKKAKHSNLCTDCKQKRLLDNYKDIDVDTQANKYF